MKTTTMLARVRAYLAQRRALGFRLQSEGNLLLEFARYSDRSRHRGHLTKKLAITWASLPSEVAGRALSPRASCPLCTSITKTPTSNNTTKKAGRCGPKPRSTTPTTSGWADASKTCPPCARLASPPTAACCKSSNSPTTATSAPRRLINSNNRPRSTASMPPPCRLARRGCKPCSRQSFYSASSPRAFVIGNCGHCLRGTTFIIQLPLRQPAAPAAPPTQPQSLAL